MSEALVLLSGGQDSTTCLYWALGKFNKVHALGFKYGQRHAIELERAAEIAAKVGVCFEVLDVSFLSQMSGSALTDPTLAIASTNGALPASFVPGRNLLFLTLAGIYAAKKGIRDLVTGVCQTDYSGYPDCRRPFVDAAESALGLAMLGHAGPFTIHTPLMHLTKAQTVKLARSMPGCWDALAHSVTCYNGNQCGTCPSCVLRIKGFAEAGEKDPACTP